MKWMRSAMTLAGAMLALAGCARAQAEPLAATTARAGVTDVSTTAALKIGVYDSRSVVIAYAGSKKHEAAIAKERADLKVAQAAGDEKKVQEIKKRVRDRQTRMHYQGFGTAPVDDVLALYPDEVKVIMAKQGLKALVSQWNEKGLKQHAGAARVDVTEALVDMTSPNARQRRKALEMRAYTPLSDARVKSAIDQGKL